MLVILQWEAKFMRHLASSSKVSLEVEMPCTYHLGECMVHQATYNCTVEAQVKVVPSHFFSMLLIMPSMKTTLLEEF
jgi:hypothetical protein